MKTYCIYLTTYIGNKLPPFYVGYSTTKKVEKQGYNGTPTSVMYGEIFKNERKINPELFKTRILSKFANRDDAKLKETKILQFFDAKNNPLYINKSNADGIFLRRKGWNHTEETKNRISKKNSGKIRNEETRKKLSKSRKGKLLSETHKERIKKTSLLNSETTAVRVNAFYSTERGIETKIRISKSLTGTNQKEETILKKSKKYEIVFGNETFIITNLNKFCKERELNQGNMCHLGKTKGYTCKLIE